MFHHVKELEFNARVSGPDPRFAKLLLEQFGGANGELSAALQYFTQAFGCRHAYPDKYDLLMDIATEEFSHLEMVGAMTTMLLNGLNGELKDAVERTSLSKIMKGPEGRDDLIQEALTAPQFLVVTGGGPACTNSQGVPWTGAYVSANGDLTVDLRSDIAAESRAKIVYEYLMQFTDDPLVKESLGFLMTREISHFQMFQAALDTIAENFPPGALEGDPRSSHTYFNLSNGDNVRGPWNEGKGPWKEGNWVNVEDPVEFVHNTRGLIDQKIEGTSMTIDQARDISRKRSSERSREVKQAVEKGGLQWSTYERTLRQRG
jgi:Mn-containing catalase